MAVKVNRLIIVELPHMNTIEKDNVEKLAWLIWQSEMNTLAFESKVIPQKMYEYAKQALQKQIDKVENEIYL